MYIAKNVLGSQIPSGAVRNLDELAMDKHTIDENIQMNVTSLMHHITAVGESLNTIQANEPPLNDNTENCHWAETNNR
jgi:hypothetical protein